MTAPAPNPRQTPDRGEVFLDHLAHFVPDMTAAEAAMAAMGFTLTPFTVQRNQSGDGLVPSGTANRCAMLDSGYLEVLTRYSDTALARQLDAALDRYTGVHLLAMTVADADAAVARLAAEGFAPDPPVRLTRAVETPDGDTDLARFSVVRVPPGTMPEGRIQILTHHTPAIVWQDRWTAQANGIRSLEAALVVVADPDAAAARYGRFLGRTPMRLAPGRWLLALERGALVLADRPEGLGPDRAGLRPWMTGHALGCDDPERSAAALVAGGAVRLPDAAPGEPVLDLPAALGGRVALVARGRLPAFAR